jgi:hypothetical protein
VYLDHDINKKDSILDPIDVINQAFHFNSKCGDGCNVGSFLKCNDNFYMT